MDDNLVELRVKSIFIEHDEPVVLLEEKNGSRHLTVRVGPFEASAIIMELEGIQPTRPLTHDLLAEVFEEAGFTMDRVVLFGSTTMRARLEYRRGLRRLRKEVRPSDALALALRVRTHIVAAPALLSSTRVLHSTNLWRAQSRVLGMEEWKAKALRA